MAASSSSWYAVEGRPVEAKLVFLGAISTPAASITFLARSKTSSYKGA